MNLDKVENYLKTKLEEYKPFYDERLFNNLKIKVLGGSFGSCHISIKNDYYSINEKYVGNYNAIDSEVSLFVCRSFDALCEQAYWREQKENEKGLKYKLTIYNDSKIVNTIESDQADKVKNELIKILIADKVRNVKTTYKHIPYTNNMRIIQKWNKEQYSLSHNTKYVYEFYNLDY